MAIGKIKMVGKKPVFEITRKPRDMGLRRKKEKPNKTVAKSIRKSNKKDYLSYNDKDDRRTLHWLGHLNNSESFSNLRAQGLKPEDFKGDHPDTVKGRRDYAHYLENVDADQDLYKYLMGTTGGNGEHKKGGKK